MLLRIEASRWIVDADPRPERLFETVLAEVDFDMIAVAKY